MTTCNCPKCNTVSKSVAAMNYAETKIWNRRGNFSGVGAGVGIGTGGIGVGIGVGTGTYSETGKSATKRAAMFDEPIRLEVSMMPIFLGILVTMLIFILPNMLQTVATVFGGIQENSKLSNLDMNELINIAKYIFPIFAFFIGWKIWNDYTVYIKKQTHYDTVIYPKKLAKYQTLRYCEHCHLLIDDKNNTVVANEFGYDKILNM